MSECTYCPPNTKQCAHFDGRWVRIIIDKVPDCIDSLQEHMEYGVFWSWPASCSDVGFFYDYNTLADVEEYFHTLNVIMRKLRVGLPEM